MDRFAVLPAGYAQKMVTGLERRIGERGDHPVGNQGNADALVVRVLDSSHPH